MPETEDSSANHHLEVAKLLTVQELAAKWQVTVDYVYDLVEAEELPVIPLGGVKYTMRRMTKGKNAGTLQRVKASGKIRFHPDDIAAFISSRRQAKEI